ncbi:helix-turn-helix domain-containing protein [Muricauda sp. JGD-17]|uniref:Helix-turn-helix domain-containing protein n=1 Tax=Flagellimonas ochracea TaxID=2696472 RepID=A0A964TFA0_9FLAO|nr:helix-turn-helix domain-containing protein [Allomuricauda ochracea]NAY93123.1 helix-turn-helix domain-containing protein [Allomuricauda ochracea]
MKGFLDFIAYLNTRQRPKKYEKLSISIEEEFHIKNEIEKIMRSGLYKINDLDLQQLSEAVSAQRHKVSMVINKHYRCNFNQWLIHFRLEEAKRMLLEEPAASIKTIIFESGFNSTSTFYEVFKRQTCLTPNEYRRNRGY